MQRPSRQTQNLARKLARKQAKSRTSGAKAKRWKKALERFSQPAETPST